MSDTGVMRGQPEAPGPTGVLRWLPGLQVLRNYQRPWLQKDLAAGLVLTAVLVPVGMAYAEASGLPPITGLYATIIPLIIYALVGPSRILVLGPDSSLAGIIAAVVLPLGAGDPARTLALAGALSIMTGLVCIAAGLLKLGFVTDLLSKPIRYGYVNGIALTVIVGQLPKLFGFSIDADGLIAEVRAFVGGVRLGETNPVALGIGLASLAVIFGCKRWLPSLPGVLVAVVGATLVVTLFDLAARAGLSVIGPLPQGLPPLTVPAVSLDDIGPLLAGAVGIALVSFADTSVLSRTFALRGGYDVDANQELIALGSANVGAGFFQGFAVSSSASRTPVAEQAGARTQVTGLVGAAAIVAMLVAFPTLLQNLPSTCLAAVVIAAAIGLIELPGLHALHRMRRSEFALSIVCFLGVALLGVLAGIFVAVGVAMLAFVERAWRPYSAVLGRIDGLKGYHDISRHPEARQIPGLVLFRWDAPLFFANAEQFALQVHRAVREAPTEARWVVVAAEPVTDIDTTAADVLQQLIDDFAAAQVHLAFAELKDPVRDQLALYGLLATIGADHLFPTIGTAVHAYVAATDTAWVDWEDVARAQES
jgi:high affinity sulfate transporter 1